MRIGRQPLSGPGDRGPVRIPLAWTGDAVFQAAIPLWNGAPQTRVVPGVLEAGQPRASTRAALDYRRMEAAVLRSGTTR